MVAMDSDILRDEIMKCGICNDFFKDPTTLSCGHNFCMQCITSHWDSELYEEVYGCPKCSKIFATRPELTTNETLAVIGNKLQKVRMQDFAQNGVTAELKKKNPRPQPQFRDKTKAKEKLQKIMCIPHKKLLNFYCRDDQQCICEECNLSEHRGHSTVTVEVERRRREPKVEGYLQKAKAQIKERELNLKKILNTYDFVKNLSTCAVEINKRAFSELTATLQNTMEELNRTIQDQEKNLVIEASFEEAQQKAAIRSLQDLISNLETLSDVKEDISFIMATQPAISQQEANSVTLDINENLSFEFVNTAINKVRQILEDTCKEALGNIQKSVKNVQLLKAVEKQEHPCKPVWHTSVSRPQIEFRQSSIPKTRKDFLKYLCPPVLDADTAHPSLTISDDNTRVFAKRQKKKTSPKRFDCWEQLLCKDGLRRGRFYWEVEWSGKGVFIGMAKEGIARKGDGKECGLGHNVNSWCLECSNVSHTAWHDDVATAITVNVSSPRIGIYLDHNAGSLEFYSVSEKMTLLHRYTSENFSEPLYPAFGLGLRLGLQSWIKIHKLTDQEKTV